MPFTHAQILPRYRAPALPANRFPQIEIPKPFCSPDPCPLTSEKAPTDLHLMLKGAKAAEPSWHVMCGGCSEVFYLAEEGDVGEEMQPL